jgi:acetylglutamate kinase
MCPMFLCASKNESMDKLTVIKIGGGVLENQAEMLEFLDQFASIKGNKILVHGGGREATKLQERLGIPAKMHEGRRITDAETLEIVTMVYGGLINKRTVALLQARQCNAIGLTGADAGIVLAKKRPVKDIDYGFVGDVEKVNQQTIKKLIEAGLVPIISPLTYCSEGFMLNTNADTMASEIAIALSSEYEVSLVFCFEKKGVLSNPKDNESVIPQIDLNSYTDLKSKGIISDGMIPKLDNSFNALHKGVSEIRITNSGAVNQASGTILKL